MMTAYTIWIQFLHPLFRVRSWNNGMRCMSLYILTWIYHLYTSDSYVSKNDNRNLPSESAHEYIKFIQ